MYFIEKNGKLVLFNEDKQKLQNNITVMPQYEGFEILETDKEIVTFKNEFYFADDAEYIEKVNKAEQERIQELFMTRSDFFDGTIDAWGVGEDELFFLVQHILTGLPLENNQKLKAINNFKNALNFYRKHDLFKILIGIPIQLTEATQVIITEESLDKYFDEVAKGNKATAWQYLPQPTAIPIDSSQTERPIEESSYDDI